MMGPRPRVCVVDDDEDVREALDGLLQSADLQAQTFGSAEEALASLDIERCDCVITDYQMGEVSGMELARRLRNRKENLPILLITAFASRDVQLQADRAGIYFLSKPFEANVLLDLVHDMLDRRSD